MKTILLLFICCFIACSLHAQWTNDTQTNTTVATAATGDIQTIGTSDGKTYVAFWHDVPAPQYYEMRLQLLDENGNPQFGPEGMLVNDTVAMSSFTTIWSMAVDHDNNVYICFNGSATGNPVYVHKISEAGTQLWGATGINPGSGFDAKVLPLASGEAIVCWLPGNKGVMQKMAADGTPVWPNPVTIEPLVASHKTSAGELAELSNGDVVVILHDRGGFSPSSLPYAQRYDGNGTKVWSNPVALTTTYFTSFNRRYPLRQDGDVLYFGYSGAQGIQPSGFLQRIDPDGSLPWGINGSDFSTQAVAFERDVQIAFQPGSPFIWAICEYSDASQSDVGEYVQKFDKTTGDRLLTDAGKEVFPISAAYISHQGELQLVDGRPVFLVSDGNSNGVFAKDLLAVVLDENGDFSLPVQTLPVGTNTSGVKSRIHLNRSYNGQVVGVWTENRPAVGISRAYAQRVVVGCALPDAGFMFATSNLKATFIDTGFGADSTTWDFGDNSFDNSFLAIHTYATAGTYTVCHYAFNACGVDTVCQSVTITCALPVAGYTLNIDAQTATFLNISQLANTYLWDFGDGVTSTQVNPVHQYTMDGTYVACLYASSICGVDTICQQFDIITSGFAELANAYHIQVSPNPNQGECTLSIDLPQAAELSWQLFGINGQRIAVESGFRSAGHQDIPIRAGLLPQGTYVLRVMIDGKAGSLSMVVR